jgi:hypothetical protein
MNTGNHIDVLVTPVISCSEEAQLAHLEIRISKGISSFIEVGEALSAIRDARLYRATHGTFESYCAEKWGMSKTHCNRLISSSEVAQSLAPMGATITSERQARELARVEPARREEVIRKADIATGGKITAAAIKEAAAPAREIIVTVEPTPCERTASKSGRYVMPPRGMFLARGAIAELEKIQPKDSELKEALRMVAQWCNEQLRSGGAR